MLFAYPYQRADGTPKTCIFGVSRQFAIDAASVTRDFVVAFDATAATGTSFNVTGDVTYQLGTIDSGGYSHGRIIRFYNEGTYVNHETKVVSSAHEGGTTTVFFEDEFSDPYDEVRIKILPAKNLTLEPAGEVFVDWSGYFSTDYNGVIRYDYGWFYILLPYANPTFNEYFSYRELGNELYPLEPVNPEPSTAVYVKEDDFVYDGNRYRLIKWKGRGSKTLPSIPVSIYLNTRTADDKSGDSSV